MPLVSVPTRVKDRYISLCLAARDAQTWSEYKTAELKARVLRDFIHDFCPGAWGIIAMEADLAVVEDACCGIVFRTMDDFKALDSEKVER